MLSTPDDKKIISSPVAKALFDNFNMPDALITNYVESLQGLGDERIVLEVIADFGRRYNNGQLSHRPPVQQIKDAYDQIKSYSSLLTSTCALCDSGTVIAFEGILQHRWRLIDWRTYGVTYIPDIVEVVLICSCKGGDRLARNEAALSSDKRARLIDKYGVTYRNISQSRFVPHVQQYASQWGYRGNKMLSRDDLVYWFKEWFMKMCRIAP